MSETQDRVARLSDLEALKQTITSSKTLTPPVKMVAATTKGSAVTGEGKGVIFVKGYGFSEVIIDGATVTLEGISGHSSSYGEYQIEFTKSFSVKNSNTSNATYLIIVYY